LELPGYSGVTLESDIRFTSMTTYGWPHSFLLGTVAVVTQRIGWRRLWTSASSS
jgi:hypothetical protein